MSNFTNPEWEANLSQECRNVKAPIPTPQKKNPYNHLNFFFVPPLIFTTFCFYFFPIPLLIPASIYSFSFSTF
jgi:hypothetical protein